MDCNINAVVAVEVQNIMSFGGVCTCGTRFVTLGNNGLASQICRCGDEVGTFIHPEKNNL